MKRRIVQNIKTGERFIETPVKYWDITLNLWQTDNANPCPMPQGHQMFKYPEPNYTNWPLGKGVFSNPTEKIRKDYLYDF